MSGFIKTRLLQAVNLIGGEGAWQIVSQACARLNSDVLWCVPKSGFQYGTTLAAG